MPRSFPKTGYTEYSEEEKPFSTLNTAVREKNNKKEKIGGDLEVWVAVLPMAVITLWLIAAGLIWSNNYKLTGTASYVSLILFTLSILSTIGLTVLAGWGGVAAQPHKVAKKIFTKQNLEESTENLLYNYRHAKEPVQKILRTKLGVTLEEIKYMDTLVHEGYTGSIKDLVTIVRKL